MKLVFKRGGTRKQEVGGVPSDVTTSSNEVFDVSTGTLAKIIGVLSGSTGLGALVASLVLFYVRDRPATEHNQAIQARCLNVRIAAVALQAKEIESRRAGLQLLLALEAMSGPDNLRTLIDSPTYQPPQWESSQMLPDCGQSGAGNAMSGSVGSIGDASENSTSGRTPESRVRTDSTNR